MSVITPSSFNETGAYATRLHRLVDAGFAGPAVCAEYARRGWRVRLVGVESVPALLPTAERLRALPHPDSLQAGEGVATYPPTLWGTIMPSHDAYWNTIFAAARQGQIATQAEAIRAVYGEDIPPATLSLSSNKLIVSPDLFPPLLMGHMQCYWSQRPGYSLDERQWRTILYDYAYLRRTWRADKAGRAELARADRAAWERGPILGLGRRLGAFWYPAPFETDDG
jgi:hypothetical protein